MSEVAKLDEFQENSRRTAPKDLSLEDELVNWSMGLAGEACEVTAHVVFYRPSGESASGVVTEAGDMLWYLARFCDTLSISLGHLYLEAKKQMDTPGLMDHHRLIMKVVAKAGGVLDYIKKIQFQHHSLDRDDLRQRLLSTFSSLLELLEYEYGTDILTVAQKNTEKLLRRYPTGFSPEASVNRES